MNAITIDEVRAHRQDACAAIRQALKKLEDATGCDVVGVNIEVRHTYDGAGKRTWTVAEIDIVLDI